MFQYDPFAYAAGLLANTLDEETTLLLYSYFDYNTN